MFYVDYNDQTQPPSGTELFYLPSIKSKPLLAP